MGNLLLYIGNPKNNVLRLNLLLSIVGEVLGISSKKKLSVLIYIQKETKRGQ